MHKKLILDSNEGFITEVTDKHYKHWRWVHIPGSTVSLWCRGGYRILQKDTFKDFPTVILSVNIYTGVEVWRGMQ